jgi:glycosyltransferase involved in cell wall biosynthesis
MRVAIDVTPTVSGVTGIARYTHAIVNGLRAAGVDVAMFSVGGGPGTPPPGTRHVKVPLRVVQLAWRAGLPPRAEQLTGPVDVVHSVDLILPPTRRPLVATVHDAAAIEEPALHPPRAVQQTANRIASLRRATVVIANSHATADAIRRFNPDVPEIVVVPLAAQQLPEPAGRPVVDGPYLLCVGEVAVRKDHVTLVRAFAQTDVDGARLVIAGPPGSGSAALHAELERYGLGDRVVVTGLVDDATLAELYAGARAFCLPSRQEGFGIPLVEAMQRGVPIVASDLPAVREVAGDAGVLVPAGDVTAFARAMESVCADDSLHARLAAAGRARAGRFSVSAMIEGTLAAYERALALA